MRAYGLWLTCSFRLYKSFCFGMIERLKMGCCNDGIQSLVVFVVIGMVTLIIPVNANLSPHFYDKVCPQALPVIRSVVQRAISREPRIGASLLRLHFHDCFVNVSYSARSCHIKHSFLSKC